MQTALLILLILLVIQGMVSLLEGWRYLAFVRRALAEPMGVFAPKAAVILPCKGAEAGLAENLRALFEQDYGDYELIFVVASEDDAALPVIRQSITAFDNPLSDNVPDGVSSTVAANDSCSLTVIANSSDSSEVSANDGDSSTVSANAVVSTDSANREAQQVFAREVRQVYATDDNAGNNAGNNAGKMDEQASPPSAENNRRARLVIAGRDDRRSEKVHNLLQAVEQVSRDAEVLVFVDSDACARRDWLRSLVAPLADEGVGATTGYRWYLPQTSSFFAALLSAWNGSVATALGDHNHNFAWGGSTAILRQTFLNLDVRGAWEHAVSDDYALSRAVRASGQRIAFVPRCLTLTRADASLAALLEFTTRQIIITRVYNPRLWWFGVISQLFFNAVFFGALMVAFSQTFTAALPVTLWVLLALIYLLGSAKGVLRMVAARRMLPQARSEIARLWWAYALLWVGVSVLYLYNFLRSATTRRIVWRGVTYEMRSATETVVERRAGRE